MSATVFAALPDRLPGEATALYHNLFLFKGKERDPHLYLTLVNITLAGGLLMIIGNALRG